MTFHSNLLIIGSTGRNIGKTEFACRIIENHAATNDLFGVKVIPVDKQEGNCHRGLDGCGLCDSLTGDFRIMEETDRDSGKDTARLLKAGAKKVFLLIVERNSLEKGIIAILQIIPDNGLVIIESNTIRKVVKPALFIVIKKIPDQSMKPSCTEVIGLADKIVEFSDMDWDFHPDNVEIQHTSWRIKQ